MELLSQFLEIYMEFEGMEQQNFYTKHEYIIIRVKKINKDEMSHHVALTEEREAYTKFLSEKPTERSRRKVEDNISIGVGEIG